jgi:excisionase family DNA binding protein
MISRPKGSKDRIRPLGADPVMTVSDSPVMTTNELCEYLRIHKANVYRMIKTNQIPHFRVASELRFHRAAIDAWMKHGK